MSQTESAPDTSPDTSTPEKNTVKPSRHPVERILVWGVIVVGILVVGIEARAKFGYDLTYGTISDRLKEVDESGEPDAALSMNEALEAVWFAPSSSGVTEIPAKKFGDLRVWHKKLNWYSLFKTYEITLIMDEERTVLQLETPNPPKEEEKPMAAPPAEVEEAPGGGGGGMGQPPAHGDMAGESRAGGGGRGGGRPRGLTGLLSTDAVAAELKLSEDQQTKIAELSETLQAESSGMRELFGQMREADESERASLFEQLSAMRAQNDARAKEALKEILDEEQMTRLQQIVWQQSRESPLLTEEVAELIELTAEQKMQLKDLSGELDAALEGVERSERGTIRESFRDRFQSVLTEEQQAQWTSLLGEPFEMPAPSRGGGPGGGDRPERPQRPE